MKVNLKESLIDGLYIQESYNTDIDRTVIKGFVVDQNTLDVNKSKQIKEILDGFIGVDEFASMSGVVIDGITYTSFSKKVSFDTNINKCFIGTESIDTFNKYKDDIDKGIFLDVDKYIRLQEHFNSTNLSFSDIDKILDTFDFDISIRGNKCLYKSIHFDDFMLISNILELSICINTIGYYICIKQSDDLDDDISISFDVTFRLDMETNKTDLYLYFKGIAW